MKNTLKQFEKRVAALEKQLRPPRRPGLILIQSIEPAQRASLEPGQRIVKDRYYDAAEEMAMIRERITRNPLDLGKYFPDGTWDTTYLDGWRPDPEERIRVFWLTAADRLPAPPPRASSEKPKSEAPKPDSELEPQNPESEATQDLVEPYDPLALDDGMDDDEDPSLLDLPDS